jgi:hypothetical protein
MNLFAKVNGFVEVMGRKPVKGRSADLASPASKTWGRVERTFGEPGSSRPHTPTNHMRNRRGKNYGDMLTVSIMAFSKIIAVKRS